MRKLRVGIFSECYHPVLNGVVVSIDTFRAELEKLGVEYFIFTTEVPEYQDDDPRVIRFSSMVPFKSGGGRYPIAWPRLVGKEAERVASLDIDLVHSQHLLSVGHLGLKIAMNLGIPSVLTYHTLLAEYTHYVPLFGPLSREYLIKKSRNICNQYDQIVTPSPSMKRVLREYGVRRPIEPIPTGVNVDDFQGPLSRKAVEEKWKIPKKSKILLYVSRIAEEKNVDFLLRAAKSLAEKRDDFCLLLIGGGPKLEEFQKLVREWGLEKRFIFTGMLPKDETNRYFGAADIFVFSSITETQGIVITEAMAAGVPAVAVAIMGPSDIIINGQDGYLVPLKEDIFAAKINELLEDNELRTKMGKSAKVNALKYSQQKCAEKMLSIYEKLIHRHHS
ncbi:MAG: hypothetical protein HW405_284 [Candidatus Berkelbacteria bacterium]|nr:hypothetical protein [Candidatus Berkelbacteria bacterium]